MKELKIAIIKLSSLGDIIVFGAFIPFLAKTLNAKIDWFVDSRFCGILESSEALNEVVSLPLKENLKRFKIKELFKMTRELKARKYDLVIDSQGLLKSSLITKFLDSSLKIGFDKFSAKEKIASRFYNMSVNIAYDEHILKRSGALINKALTLFNKSESNLELMLDSRDLMFKSSENNLDSSLLNMLNTESKKVLFIIESSLESKTYSANNFIELGRLLKDREIYILYNALESKAHEIKEGLLVHKVESKILPKMSLLSVRALLAKMDLIIGGDTGITHLAWALKRPSITLYGNTPSARFSLKTKDNISLSGNDKPSYDKNDMSINNISAESIYEAMSKAGL